ncbi:hypothetical protein ACF0H5_008673 [Mactra antiquata]
MTADNFKFRDYNVVFTALSSCLSIFGAILIFLTYFKGKPEVKNFTRLLLVYLTIADIMTAVGNLVASIRYDVVHGHKNHYEHCLQNASNIIPDNWSISHTTVGKTKEHLMWLCKGQSFVTTYSNMSSYLWTLVIAGHLWFSVVFKTQTSETTYMHVLYHVVCWLVPLSVVIVLQEKDYLGEDYCYGTGVWCGIRSNLHHKTIERWMYIADIGWQVPCYILTCLVYMHLKLHLYLRHRGKNLDVVSVKLRNEDTNFVYVWLIIYLLKVWGMTRFFITTYVSQETLQNQHLRTFLGILLSLQSYGASGQAFWNCILFCFLDKTVRHSMKDWFCRRTSERRHLLSSSESINR